MPSPRPIPTWRSRLGGDRVGASLLAWRAHFIRLNVEPLEARLAPAIVNWDGGAGTLNWLDQSNWDGDQLPVAIDEGVTKVSGGDGGV